MNRTSCLFLLRSLCVGALCLAMAACSPALDWRDFRDPAGAYTALMPAKPTTHVRPIRINNATLDMQMSAVEVSEVMYAIGSTRLPDPKTSPQDLIAMKDALLKNIQGSVTSEKSTRDPATGTLMIEVEATGSAGQASKGLPRAFYARFYARGPALYQVVIVGPQGKVTNEAVETFLTSFKLL